MDKKENIEKQIRTLKEIREMLEVNRIFTVYGYSFKNSGRVGSRQKTNAGILPQADFVLCENTEMVERTGNRIGGRI